MKRCKAAIIPEVIKEYFTQLGTVVAGMLPSNKVNYDETNLKEDSGKNKVL